MKKRFTLALVLAGASLLAVSNSQAQTATGQDTQVVSDQDIQLLRQDLRSNKKQLIAANLKLTDTEATKFWPIYDQYAAELTKINDDKYVLIKEYSNNYGSLTDPQAISLITRSLTVDKAVAELRLKYVPIINKVLPGTKTATFFQIDRRLTSLIDIQLASALPLVQDQK